MSEEMRYLFILLTLVTLPLLAKVEVVMFFSPDCAHCHDVLDTDIPPLMQKYGRELELVLVNVGTATGSEIYYAAARKYNIPETDWGVPTFIVGDTYIVGSKEIPKRLPTLIASAMEGGLSLPDIPGLSQEVTQAEQTPYVDTDVFILDSLKDIAYLPRTTVAEKIVEDPIGSVLATALLIGMVASLVFVTSTWTQRGIPHGPSPKSFSWVTPVLCAVGVAIASYLTYLEITGNAAFCGPVGNCNEVQQSAWAWIFGVVPVGLLGVFGYIAMAGAWLLRQKGKFDFLLPTLTFSSVLVGAYLTFLEPFVIGAVCSWCLLSGAITLGLLWLNYPTPCSQKDKSL